MTRRISVTQSDAVYFIKEIEMSESVVGGQCSNTASDELINYFD